ncbi:MAG: glycosyltransferase family 2 protein [Hyphomonadaceae bacterium]
MPSTSPDTQAPASVNETVRRDVTVIIAAWRAAGTIGKAVASALAQPETAEVVVVDDCSGDDGATLAAARGADDGSGRLTVFALDRNSGPARARNAAIKASKAPWIAVLDSDDYMEPGRFAKLAALRDTDLDFIADDLLQAPEGQPISDGRPMWFEDDLTPIDVSLELFFRSGVSSSKRKRREMGFLKPLMRRAFLEKHALSYDETMRLGEDFDLYSWALMAGAKMRLVPWAGYVSVMRRGSLSLSHSRADLVALMAGKDRLLASGKLSRAEAKQLKRVRATSNVRLLWVDLMAYAKKGAVFHVAWVMLKDVRQAPYLLRNIWFTLTKRFRSRQ